MILGAKRLVVTIYIQYHLFQSQWQVVFGSFLFLQDKVLLILKQLVFLSDNVLSRVNDYIAGRSEPTLKIARLLCWILNIPPVAMLGF